MLEEERHNLPKTSMDGSMHSIPKLLEVMAALECNKADTEWYVRKATNLPPVDPKAGKLLRFCEEEDATRGPSSPMKDS